jgi:glucan phosphorylase
MKPSRKSRPQEEVEDVRTGVALFKPLVDSLLEHDPYMLLADYQSYVDCQDRVDTAYRDPRQWTRMSSSTSHGLASFLPTAPSVSIAKRSGRYSRYCDWRVQ